MACPLQFIEKAKPKTPKTDISFVVTIHRQLATYYQPKMDGWF